MDNLSNEKKLPIGIWYIEGNLAFRRRSDDTVFEIPITEENKNDFLVQIEKQDFARNLFDGFQNVPNDDVNLIGYLHRILRDSFSFLDESRKNQLIVRMEEIKNSDYLSTENKTFLNYLIDSLKEDKTNVFLEIFEEFEKHNAACLVEPLIEKKSSEYHR